MENLVTIKEKINQMAEMALSMLRATFSGFMEHDLDIFGRVLKDEGRLNDMEKALTVALVEIAKSKTAVQKRNMMLLANIVEHLEEVGDYIKDMIERIEIKIEEKLLFSNDALDEYKHLYQVVETELSDVVNALKMDDKNFATRILCGREHVDTLVQQYREAHAQRLICGVCDPRASNMFLNLLDFTAQISNHTKAIAKNIAAIE